MGGQAPAVPSAVAPGLRGRALAAAVWVRRALDRPIEAMAYLSGLLFLLTALYITFDVTGRRFGVFTRVTDEMSGYALAVGTMFALAYALRVGGHVRIDVLLPYLPRPVRRGLDLLAVGLMALFAWVLTFFAWRQVLFSWSIKAKAMSFIGTPIYIPQFFVALGFTVLLVEASLLFLCGVVEALLRGPSHVTVTLSQEQGEE